MPFIPFRDQEIPAYLNIDHVVGMQLVIESEELTLVKILSTRTELDTTMEFDTVEQAEGFIDHYLEVSAKAKQVVFDVTATTTTTRG